MEGRLSEMRDILRQQLTAVTNSKSSLASHSKKCPFHSHKRLMWMFLIGQQFSLKTPHCFHPVPLTSSTSGSQGHPELLHSRQQEEEEAWA